MRRIYLVMAIASTIISATTINAVMFGAKIHKLSEALELEYRHVGKIFSDKTQEIIELMNVLIDLGEFLNTHNLTPVPHELLLRIGDLQNAEVSVRKPYEIDEHFGMGS